MTKNAKTLVGTVVGVTVGAVVYQLITLFVFPAPSFDKQMMKAAEEINKNCPFMVDQDTRLDNTVAGPGKEFIYNYTLVNYGEDEVDKEELQNYITPFLINNIKTNEEMENFRSNKVSLTYSYKDKSGIFLFSVKIKPSDYE
jgi:glutathione peroxidase-family protein